MNENRWIIKESRVTTFSTVNFCVNFGGNLEQQGSMPFYSFSHEIRGGPLVADWRPRVQLPSLAHVLNPALVGDW